MIAHEYSLDKVRELEKEGRRFNRAPLLSQNSIDIYLKMFVEPFRGTVYGDLEKMHWQELKLAHKLGKELLIEYT